MSETLSTDEYEGIIRALHTCMTETRGVDGMVEIHIDTTRALAALGWPQDNEHAEALGKLLESFAQRQGAGIVEKYVDAGSHALCAVPRTPDASPQAMVPLHAERRVRDLLGELARDWRQIESLGMRWWVVDDDGAVTLIPNVIPDGCTGREQITTVVSGVVSYCSIHHPAAAVLGTEGWAVRIPDEQNLRELFMRHGRLPDMSNPENRRMVQRIYGGQCSEQIQLWAELRDGRELFRVFELDPRRELTGVKYRSRFKGVVSGRWRPGDNQLELIFPNTSEDSK
jgi:hypothetical protein